MKTEILLTDSGNLFIAGILVRLDAAETDSDADVMINDLAFKIKEDDESTEFLFKSRGRVLLDTDRVILRGTETVPIVITPRVAERIAELH